jgi:hypothetical protein
MVHGRAVVIAKAVHTKDILLCSRSESISIVHTVDVSRIQGLSALRRFHQRIGCGQAMTCGGPLKRGMWNSRT